MMMVAHQTRDYDNEVFDSDSDIDSASDSGSDDGSSGVVEAPPAVDVHLESRIRLRAHATVLEAL